ncbi:MAG: efflux RND transporter periplasmic adaptor subunit [Pseudomonadota bacterium]
MALQPVNDNTPTAAGIRGTEAQDRVVAQPRRHWAVWAALAVGLVVAAVVLSNMASTWARADVTVARERLRIAEVTQGRFVRDVAIQGEIVAAVKPTLFAPSAGKVALRVAPGDVVSTGDVIAEIDSPTLKNSLDQARALLQSQQIALEREVITGRQTDLQNQQAVDLAEVAIKAAERELRRAEQSWEYQVISRQDYEKAVDDLARAQLEYTHKQADAQLFRERQDFEERAQALEMQQQELRVAELERQVSALSVRSPVAGVVGSLLVEDRSAVAADLPLVSVVDLTRLELEVPLVQGYADDIAVGMPATINYQGTTFAARVSSISPEVTNNTVATRIAFVDGQPEGLRQNQRLTGRIEIETVENAFMIPRGPYFNSDGGRAVYLIDGDFAIRTPVTVGATSTSVIQVLSGVNAGDRIVVSNTQAFEGAPEVLITD